MLQKLSITLGEEMAGHRFDKAIAASVPDEFALSRSQIVRLMKEGHIQDVSGVALTAPKAVAQGGEQIILMLPEARASEVAPQRIALNILYEDEALLVVDKPAGMVVHPAPGSPDGTLVNAVLHHCAGQLSGIGGVQRPGIVHRIDKDTSGVLVVAKHDAAHHGLAAQFAAHSITREYIAFVHGAPSAADPRLMGLGHVAQESGGVLRISGNIDRHPHDRKRMKVVADRGRHAITRIAIVERYGPEGRPVAAQIRAQLETGRTHQIRVHLAHIGHGLLGDPVYGGKRHVALKGFTAEDAETISSFPRQALHAARLGFLHPMTQDYLEFETPLPEDMQALSAALGEKA